MVTPRTAVIQRASGSFREATRLAQPPGSSGHAPVRSAAVEHPDKAHAISALPRIHPPRAVPMAARLVSWRRMTTCEPILCCAGSDTALRRYRSSDCSGTGVAVLGEAGLLLAVCLDQALDELVDVARLGQLPFGQLVAQLGLGEAFVALAGLVVSLPGLPALGEAGLACPLPLGLLGLLRSEERRVGKECRSR